MKALSLSLGFFLLPVPAFAFTGMVVHVCDGDTISVLPSEGPVVKIRLANIDAPEKNQPFGIEAKQALAALVAGRTVEVRPQTIDKYRRTVSVVLLDGVDVSAVMVSKGLAWVYTKYNKDDSLPAMEAEERESKRGLWADDNPMPPWDWRHRDKHHAEEEFDFGEAACLSA